MEITQQDFETLVEQAVDDLPEQFAGYLNEVAVIVADQPDPALCAKLNLANPHFLLGLFQGLPLNRQNHAVASHPSQITLYRLNIMRQCRTPDQIKQQVRKTLIHELGHYIGFSEKQLRDLHY